MNYFKKIENMKNMDRVYNGRVATPSGKTPTQVRADYQAMTAANMRTLLEIAELSYHWFKATESLANHDSIFRIQLKGQLQETFKIFTKEDV
jgi:hypothetical protein